MYLTRTLLIFPHKCIFDFVPCLSSAHVTHPYPPPSYCVGPVFRAGIFCPSSWVATQPLHPLPPTKCSGAIQCCLRSPDSRLVTLEGCMTPAISIATVFCRFPAAGIEHSEEQRGKWLTTKLQQSGMTQLMHSRNEFHTLAPRLRCKLQKPNSANLTAGDKDMNKNQHTHTHILIPGGNHGNQTHNPVALREQC